MSHLLKSKNKDFGGVIAQKQYAFEGVLWSYVLKNLDIEALLQKIGFLSCIVLARRSEKKSHFIQFPLAIFARIRENLLVSQLLDINEDAKLWDVEKS